MAFIRTIPAEEASDKLKEIYDGEMNTLGYIANGTMEAGQEQARPGRQEVNRLRGYGQPVFANPPPPPPLGLPRSPSLRESAPPRRIELPAHGEIAGYTNCSNVRAGAITPRAYPARQSGRPG